MFRSVLIKVLSVACLALFCTVPCIAAEALASALDRPALLLRAPSHSVLLDVTRSGERLVAVGERGLILLSDDDARTWRQVHAPVSVSLTAVRFAASGQGWAVGHQGVVLRSTDRGETWQRQFDGTKAAAVVQAVAEAALARTPEAPAAKRALAVAQQLVADGADKPFLDLYVADSEHAVVVGAYGLIFATADGGRSWAPWLDRLDNPHGLHLYAIRVSGDVFYIAGERGLLLRSLDGGQQFKALATPYKGSYFNLVVGTDGSVLAAGLRGNAYFSADRGAHWQAVEAGVGAGSFAAATVLVDGRLFLASQSGQIYLSRDEGRHLEALYRAPFPITGLAPSRDGALVAVGMLGAARIEAKDLTVVRAGTVP